MANQSLEENQILLREVRSVMNGPSMEHLSQVEVKTQKMSSNVGGVSIVPSVGVPQQSPGEPMSFYKGSTAEERMQRHFKLQILKFKKIGLKLDMGGNLGLILFLILFMVQRG
ncbi:hypothetical protein CsSME_00052844 [Camellia sinensis var. sinensis]